MTYFAKLKFSNNDFKYDSDRAKFYSWQDMLCLFFRTLIGGLAFEYYIDGALEVADENGAASTTADSASDDGGVLPVDTSVIPVNTSHMTTAELQELVGRLRRASGTGTRNYPVVAAEDCVAAVKGDLSSPVAASPVDSLLPEGAITDGGASGQFVQCSARQGPWDPLRVLLSVVMVLLLLVLLCSVGGLVVFSPSVAYATSSHSVPFIVPSVEHQPSGFYSPVCSTCSATCRDMWGRPGMVPVLAPSLGTSSSVASNVLAISACLKEAWCVVSHASITYAVALPAVASPAMVSPAVASPAVWDESVFRARTAQISFRNFAQMSPKFAQISRNLRANFAF